MPGLRKGGDGDRTVGNGGSILRPDLILRFLTL